MMRSARKSVRAVSIIIAIAFLVPNLPIFPPEDVSRDGRVGLRDTILLVKDFKQSTPTADGSLKNINTLITAFHITSGLEQVIQPDDHRAIHPDESPFALTPAPVTVRSDEKTSTIDEMKIGFNSITIQPNIPPPRIAT